MCFATWDMKSIYLVPVLWSLSAYALLVPGPVGELCMDTGTLFTKSLAPCNAGVFKSIVVLG